jgi:hypothetical protein
MTRIKQDGYRFAAFTTATQTRLPKFEWLVGVLKSFSETNQACKRFDWWWATDSDGDHPCLIEFTPVPLENCELPTCYKANLVEVSLDFRASPARDPSLQASKAYITKMIETNEDIATTMLVHWTFRKMQDQKSRELWLKSDFSRQPEEIMIKFSPVWTKAETC